MNVNTSAKNALAAIGVVLSLASLATASGPWKEYPVNEGKVRINANWPKDKPIMVHILMADAGLAPGVHEKFDQFCHSAGIAQFIGLKNMTTGIKDNGLAVAAKATGHPELAYSKAIRHGISAKAGEAFGESKKEPEDVFMVLRFHGNTSNPPSSEGSVSPKVPVYFTNTYSNTFNGKDRRVNNFRWCEVAFQKYGQPCTQFIEPMSQGHNRIDAPGTMDPVVEYLKDIMPLRLPKTIPMDGSPWKMNPIRLEEGWVAQCTMGNTGGRTHHTNARAYAWKDFPGDPRKQGSFWLPGPKTAAIWLDWVKKTGGTTGGAVETKNLAVYRGPSHRAVSIVSPFNASKPIGNSVFTLRGKRVNAWSASAKFAVLIK